MLREIGDALRRAGLTQNALLGWAGTHRLSALAPIIPALAARPITPASAVLALFVAGAEVPLARLRGVPIDALVAHALAEVLGATVRARVAVLPLEQTLLVCDRFDAPPTRELVMCPDDSSYHLASAIAPGRRDRWIDLATGSAFAPLARPALATHIDGVDLNPRAVAFAHLGAGLSGCAHVTVACADIADGAATRAPLVTCNAPILGDPDPAMWRATDAAFFERMWRTARDCVAPGGEIIVHCVLDGVPDVLEGDATIVVYTPPDERGYCVVWWSPDGPPRRVQRSRALTVARAHLEPRDRDDARTM